MKPLIEVRALRVRRAGRTVLTVDSLDLHSGEVLALVGPNGAGKTTLLLALSQLLGRQEGDFTYKGTRLQDADLLGYRRRIALVFQHPLLLDMTVEKNVALGLSFRGVSPAEAASRVDYWLERLGVDGLARRRAIELSRGEAQRVSLARALVLDPELLLLDEPFPALDPAAKASLLHDLGDILAEDHRTAILVTHNLKEASTLSDRVAVILEGRLRQVGRVRQLRARPVDSEVASFLRSRTD